MRASVIACFVLAVLAMFVAIQNAMGEANRAEGVENLVGYAVGLLVPIALLIIGLILWVKRNRIN